MSDLFQASRPDGRADWRVLFDIFIELEPGATVTLEALLTALETEDRSRMYRAVQRAKKELWEHGKSVDSVKGFGYRMLLAEEFEHQSLGYKKRGRKQIGNAVAVANSTPLAGLPDIEKARMIRFQGAMVALARAFDEMVVKVDDHEERLLRLEKGQH